MGQDLKKAPRNARLALITFKSLRGIAVSKNM